MALEIVDWFSETINWPSNFTIDPTGNFIIVANQNANNITVLKRDAATGKVIYISPNYIRFAFLQFLGLFSERGQQNFRKPPVEESPKKCNFKHFKIGKIIGQHQGKISRSHNPVFRIEIHKNLQFVAFRAIFGDITVWQQYIAIRPPIELGTGFGKPHNFKQRNFSNFNHAQFLRMSHKNT
jgi:DNA-binding beta-propeller fold protein YncE